MSYNPQHPSFLTSRNLRGAQIAFPKPAFANRVPRRIASQSRIPFPPCAGERTELESKAPGTHRPACVSKGKEMTQAGKKKKSKSRKRHNSSWACTRLQPRPHTELGLPHPQARGPARWGPEWAAPPSTGLGPADPSPGCAGRVPRKRAAQWVWPAEHPRRVLAARPAARIAAPRTGEPSSVPSPGPGRLSMPVRRRPRVLLPSARGGAS